MKLNFKAKIISAIVIPTMVLVSVGAAALAMEVYDEQRNDASDKVKNELESVQRLLQESARLMNTKVHSSMNVMKDVATLAGSPSMGAPVEITTGVIAPNISFGNEMQAGNFRVVDKVTEMGGGTATIFSKSGDSFVRIATNVRKSDNTRAVGTVLDPQGPAYAALKEGHSFEGVVDILGNPFFTSYQPITDAQNSLIGIYYVGYEASLASVETAIGQTKIMKTGFLALVDGKNKVRFTTQGISPDAAAKTILNTPEGWKVESRKVAGWDYKVYAAYPKTELAETAISTAELIIGGGVILAVLLSLMVGMLIERMVISPLGGEPDKASSAMAEIAAGKLNVKFDKARGGSLMNNMSVMQEKLRNIVNAIHKSVERAENEHANFDATLAVFVKSKSEVPEMQKAAEAALIDAAKKVTKSDETVSRAVDRFKL